MTGTVLKKSDLWKEGSGAGDTGLDETGNGLDGVAQLAFLHSLYVGITMIVEVMDGIQQTLRSQIIFCKNFTESLSEWCADRDFFLFHIELVKPAAAYRFIFIFYIN